MSDPRETAEKLRGICEAINLWHWQLHRRGGKDREALTKIRELEATRSLLIQERLAQDVNRSKAR